MTDIIEVFGHGGDVETAASRFGGDPADFLDFSANINPLGPPLEVLRALEQGLNANAVLRYPDPGHRALKSALGSRLGVAPECISVGNGAAESMALLLLGLAPRRVGTVEPGFSEYAALSRQFGAEVLSVRGRKELDWRAEPEDIERLLEQVDMLFLGQPNNPNGIQYPVAVLERLALKAGQTGAVLVVDEAFMDFIPAENRQSLAARLHEFPQVILIRSMTKFYAIPGLRLGYALGRPELIRAMTAKQVTWSVNGLALIAGEACLRSGERFERETLRQIALERNRLTNALQGYGCEVTPGEANFLLVRLPDPWTAATMQAALGGQGILIRSCAMYPGLTERHVRIAVKDEPSNKRLIEALGCVITGQTSNTEEQIGTDEQLEEGPDPVQRSGGGVQ